MSYETIRKLTGFSQTTISKSIEKLKDSGLIEVETVRGNLRRYYCKDIVPFVKLEPGQNPEEILRKIEDGEDVRYDGKAVMTYIPSKMTENRKEIKRFLSTGELPVSQNIKIENFYLQINIDGIETITESIEDEEIRSALMRIASIAKDRKAAADGVVIGAKKKK